MTSRPDSVHNYIAITHPLGEVLAHGDSKPSRLKYQVPTPGSGKVSYHCNHEHHRHCAMLACTCACHAPRGVE